MSSQNNTIKEKLIEKVLSQYDSNDELIDLLNIDLTSLVEAEAERILTEMTDDSLIDLI